MLVTTLPPTACTVYDAGLRLAAVAAMRGAATGQRVAILLVDIARFVRDLDFLRHEDTTPATLENRPEYRHARADACGVELECGEQYADRAVPRGVASREGGHLVLDHGLKAPGGESEDYAPHRKQSRQAQPCEICRCVMEQEREWEDQYDGVENHIDGRVALIRPYEDPRTMGPVSVAIATIARQIPKGRHGDTRDPGDQRIRKAP